MDYLPKNQEYNKKYNVLNLDKNNKSISRSYQRINAILNNLDKYYNAFSKLEYELQKGGGRDDESEIPLSNEQKHKIKKYKKFIKKAKNTIGYFKDVAEQYYNAYIQTNLYYNQLLNQLKLKRGELEGLQRKVYDLSINNTKNVEKLDALEIVLKLLESLAKNPMSVELDLKNKLGNNVIETDTKTLINGKTVSETGSRIELDKQVGGAQVEMDLDDFQERIGVDLSELKKHAEGLDADKNFMESKISKLKERMGKIVEDNNAIFKVRAKVEWIVNELEKKVVDQVEEIQPQEYQPIYDEIKNIIEEVKGKGEISKDMAEYISELENYASYLENIIKSTNQTVNNMSTTNVAAANTDAEQKVAATEQLGGNKIMYGRGGLKEKYVDISKGSVEKIQIAKNALNLKHMYVIFDTTETVVNDTWDSSLYDTKASILPILKILDQTLDKFIIVRENFIGVSGISDLLKDDTEGNMEEKWNQAFSSRDTNFYKDMLDKEVYQFTLGNTIGNAKDFLTKYIASNDFLKEIVAPTTAVMEPSEATSTPVTIPQQADTYKPIINFDTLITFENDSDLFDILNNTIIFYNLLMYFLINTIIVYKTFQDPVYTDITSEENMKFLDTIGKSYISTVYSTFQKYTGQPPSRQLRSSEGGGGEPLDNILKVIEEANVKPDGKIGSISPERIKKFKLYETEYTNVIKKKSNASSNEIQKEIAKDEVKKISELGTVMRNLFKKVASKLGETSLSGTAPVVDPTAVDSVQNFAQFYNKIIETKQSQGGDKKGGSYNNFNNYKKLKLNNKTMYGGAFSSQEQQLLDNNKDKPRLHPYLKQLIECKNELNAYIPNLRILSKLTKKYDNGDLAQGCDTTDSKVCLKDNMSALLDVYYEIDNAIKEGINGYVKIIPMIFFTIEFPPKVYYQAGKTIDPCVYQLTFDEKNEMVLYNTLDVAGCDKISVAKDVKLEVNSHAAFLASNRQNGTKFLLDDTVIGIEKLVKMAGNPDDPQNKTINMMFALGASGTGKTTRYFGVEGRDPNDKVGIVNKIIQTSVESNSGSASPEVSIAYFISYGQKTDVSKTDPKFNELLIFFDVNKVINNESDKYSVYKMDTTTSSTETTRYTDFYVKLVNKPLYKVDYSQVESFISDGANFPTDLSGTESGNFRNVLESESNPVWTKIVKDGINETGTIKIGDLTNVFETLINEQKKINTVLPTKNNIESSRAHTCVLIKIGSGPTAKYFPLFDMAGTENTDNMKNFIQTGHQIPRMGKLVKMINQITQDTSILKDDSGNAYASLLELLNDELISGYVKELAGGAKSKKKISEIPQSKLDLDEIPTSDTYDYAQFLEKIYKEGFYINHTIGMLIFTAMCVGKSIQTTAIYGSDGKITKDNFDSVGTDLVFPDMKNFICLTNEQTENCVGTRLLLSELNYDAILSSSCIWTQILFSFLYWNQETEKTSKKLIEQVIIKKEYTNEYLCDCSDSEYEGIKLSDAYDIKKNKDGLNVLLQSIINKITEVNGTINKYNTDLTDKSYSLPKVLGIDIVDGTKLNISKITLPSTCDPIKLAYFNSITTRKTFDEFKSYIDNLKNKGLTDEQRKTALKWLCDKSKEWNTSVCNNIESLSTEELNQLVDKWPEYTDGLLKFIGANRKGDKVLSNEQIFEKVTKAVVELESDKLKNTMCNLVTTQNQLIETFNNSILNADSELVNLLIKVIRSKNKNNKMATFNSPVLIIGNEKISDILEKFYTLPVLTIPCAPEQIIRNQMKRIQDSRISASKMVLMHLVTGQGVKLGMVNETFCLTQTLYNATNIGVKDIPEDQKPKPCGR